MRTKPYSSIQLLYLLRLARLLRQEVEYRPVLKVDDWRYRLIGLAITSTLQSCIAVGINEDGAKLLERYRQLGRL